MRPCTQPGKRNVTGRAGKLGGCGWLNFADPNPMDVTVVESEIWRERLRSEERAVAEASKRGLLSSYTAGQPIVDVPRSSDATSHSIQETKKWMSNVVRVGAKGTTIQLV